MSLEFRNEQEKYLWLNEHTGYGSSFHAQGALDYIQSLNMQSVCDVGTGRGDFCRWVSSIGCPTVYGVDFAIEPSKPEGDVTYINAFSHDIPLPDSSVEYVTSFDVLEHIPVKDMNPTLDEFKRLATKGWIFSIGHHPSVSYRDNVGELHVTIRDKAWWSHLISPYGDIEFYKNYWVVSLKG
jgi:ubiquinone/menaquinone biosynthesis C-methylase UbiE